MFSWGAKGKILELKGIDLWYESFGEKSNPCFFLIMGGGCQGILWPDLFCEKLASFGFFVIRFDARDTGYSSYFDYKKCPYTLLDMANDGTLLLDFLTIKQAHVMGTSMGGAIAQIMAAHFPEKVLSVTLLATTVDFRNLVSAIQGHSLERLPLSSPSKECLNWIESFSESHPKLNWIQKITKQLEGWKMLNGPEAPFDFSYYGKMMIKTVLRQRSYKTLLNHVSAITSSTRILLDTLGKIKAPVLIIQGKQDPIFPKDHAEFLAASLPQSQLFLIDKMGHNLNSCFYDEILDKIQTFVGKK
jgi:pimeloyl-ACP methyl ester carboxylesterase